MNTEDRQLLVKILTFYFWLLLLALREGDAIITTGRARTAKNIARCAFPYRATRKLNVPSDTYRSWLFIFAELSTEERTLNGIAENFGSLTIRLAVSSYRSRSIRPSEPLDQTIP
ncbi:MAG: hypothetical protein AB7G75_27780 [Candidatus Binatia bacterium]